MATQRIQIDPAGPPRPRARGAIVAKGGVRRVQAVVPVGDRVAIAHHEGMADSPGGVMVVRRRDFAVVVSVTGVSGPLLAGDDFWIASGPLWRGRLASARLLDPDTLAVLDRLPLSAPFARTGPRRIVAHTPVRAAGHVDGVFRELDEYEVDPGEVRAGRVELPARAGLVELDLATRRLELLVESEPFDPLSLCAISPDRATVYAASSGGRIVAVDLASRAVRWERASPRDVSVLSLHAMAIDLSGGRIAVAGSGRDVDVLVLDSASGRPLRELCVCRLVGRAMVTSLSSARVEALAFHPSGWLAIATSGGVIAELAADGTLTAFRAAGAGIDAIAFVDEESSLLIGGREPQLRIWPVDL
jgi:hypothetical protein